MNNIITLVYSLSFLFTVFFYSSNLNNTNFTYKCSHYFGNSQSINYLLKNLVISEIKRSKEFNKVTEGHLSLEVPKQFQVITFYNKGAEFTISGNRVGGIGYGKYDHTVPLENYVGNHVLVLTKTKLKTNNFSEAYRIDVSIGEPAVTYSNKVTRFVHYFFIDRNNDIIVQLSFDKNYVNEDILKLISESVKYK